MVFEWDETKADRNQQKHGVEFREAITTFDDLLSELFDDAEHSVKRSD